MKSDISFVTLFYCTLLFYVIYLFIFAANENRYEGEWENDKKHGDGKFYHLDKGQVFVGTWLNDIAKCGVMEDFNRSTAVNATQYAIPEV